MNDQILIAVIITTTCLITMSGLTYVGYLLFKIKQNLTHQKIVALDPNVVDFNAYKRQQKRRKIS